MMGGGGGPWQSMRPVDSVVDVDSFVGKRSIPADSAMKSTTTRSKKLQTNQTKPNQTKPNQPNKQASPRKKVQVDGTWEEVEEVEEEEEEGPGPAHVVKD